ncbi:MULTISPECIES: DUF397 domain-containing protein [unclassified Streptomyces]|uniref:DUF397 domain-containing protein n=1 Tax=unclassified Streptomyces TaxID=2593676 RepID=UPI002238A8F2|nr:DUF397 domain-containing protein [Streptomyces sp. SHP 1-2]MCW5252391.1 DUF397 domain-containing protein [Streptomyces sp. SHP 1-2]
MNTQQSEVPQLHWFKSSHSGGAGGDCIEVATAPAAVHVRDSKTPAHGTLTVRPDTWTAFLGLTRQG